MDKIEKEFNFNETFPKKIFLQPGQVWEGVEITIWSPYANEEQNVEYVRKDVHKKALKAKIQDLLKTIAKEMRSNIYMKNENVDWYKLNENERMFRRVRNELRDQIRSELKTFNSKRRGRNGTL